MQSVDIFNPAKATDLLVATLARYQAALERIAQNEGEGERIAAEALGEARPFSEPYRTWKTG